MPKRWIPGEIITASGLNQTTPFGVVQQPVPNLTVNVAPGSFILGEKVVTFSGGNSPQFSVPSSNPRIDLLVVTVSGTLEIVQGTESATPSAPTYPADKFVICEVYNRPGQTCIKDINDNTNGYIYKDVRAFMGTNPNIVSLVAGESLPASAPVYIASNGKIYGCDASCSTTTNFIGFTMSSCSENSSVPVILTGIVSGFSNLSVGSFYYIQNRSYYVDQSQTDSDTYTGTAAGTWQSFTPSQSKFYGASVLLYNPQSSSQSFQVYFEIRSGEGTGGTLLVSGIVPVTMGASSTEWINLILEYPISLTVGQRHTLYIQVYGGSISWCLRSADVYGGGRAAGNASHDYAFKTFYNTYPPSIGTSPGKNSVKVGIAISSTALKIVT